MDRLRVLDLFSGIGGFSLGLERAGMQTVAFCEIEPFACGIIQKYWPKVKLYNDIRKLTGDRLREDGITVDLFCGGFPCQDISDLNRHRQGLAGQNSGLWREYYRLIAEIRPQWIIIENVVALRRRGLDTILGQFASIRYNAEWHCIPASAVGTPHTRDRLWIIAYPNEETWRDESQVSGVVVDKLRPLLDETFSWLPEPTVDRISDGISRRLDIARYSSLGNAVVPRIPELIGRAILARSRSTTVA